MSTVPVVGSSTSTTQLARELRDQIAADLALSPTGPAPAASNYLTRARDLLNELSEQVGAGGHRDVGVLVPAARHCAVVGSLLRATADAVAAPVATRVAWDAARRFLTAAQATVTDLIEEPPPPPATLRLIRGDVPDER